MAINFKAGPDGKLPPGATHELVEDEQGQVKAVRRRFSARGPRAMQVLVPRAWEEHRQFAQKSPES